jgi:hypothetical protein
MRKQHEQLSCDIYLDTRRGPEVHPMRPYGNEPHIHVGPVDHVPVNSEVP